MGFILKYQERNFSASNGAVVQWLAHLAVDHLAAGSIRAGVKILFFFFVLFYKVFFIKKREKNFVLKIDEIDEIYSENAKKL